MSRQSFERFYLRKVALNEGCGCAEQVIGTRDLDDYWAHAAARRASRDSGSGLLSWCRRVFRRQALRRPQ